MPIRRTKVEPVQVEKEKQDALDRYVDKIGETMERLLKPNTPNFTMPKVEPIKFLHDKTVAPTTLAYNIMNILNGNNIHDVTTALSVVEQYVKSQSVGGYFSYPPVV